MGEYIAALRMVAFKILVSAERPLTLRGSKSIAGSRRVIRIMKTSQLLGCKTESLPGSQICPSVFVLTLDGINILLIKKPGSEIKMGFCAIKL